MVIKKNRTAYQIATMMLIRMYRKNVLNSLDFMEYGKRLNSTFPNELVKSQVFMHVKDLYDKRINQPIKFI